MLLLVTHLMCGVWWRLFMFLQLRPGCSVAIQVSPTSASLLTEARPGSVPTDDELARLRAALEAEMGFTISPVLVLAKQSLPKTTSGKVRRRECKRLYFAGGLRSIVQSTDAVPPFVFGRKSGRGGGSSRRRIAMPTTFAGLLASYGVADPSQSLAANGVDSVRLAQFISEAKRLFGITITPVAAATIPAAALGENLSLTRAVALACVPSSGWDMLVEGARQGASSSSQRLQSPRSATSAAAPTPGAVPFTLQRADPTAAPTPPEATVGVGGKQLQKLCVTQDADAAPPSPTSVSARSVYLTANPLRGDPASVAVDVAPSPGHAPASQPGPNATPSSAKAPDAEFNFLRHAAPGAALWQLVIVLGVVGVVLACMIPAAHVHVELTAWLLRDHASYVDPWLTTFNGGPGLALAAVPLTWMACYTVAVVVLKWIIIGRYKRGIHPLWSAYYLRFFAVDRLLAVWEATVGCHLLGTPYLNLVYKALGCRYLPFSVQLDSFVREAELLTAGHHSCISGRVMARVLDGRRGLLLERVRVQAMRAVPADKVVYPGEVFDEGPRRHESMAGLPVGPSIYQRAATPFAVLAVYALSLYVSSWTTVRVFGMEEGNVEARLPACFIISSVLVAVGVAVARHVVSLSFTIDRLYDTAASFLKVWVGYSAMTTWLYRLMGAKLALDVQVSHINGVILPSTAHLVKVGDRTTLSNCRLRPTASPIIIGRGVTVGLTARVAGGVRIGDGAAVGTLAAVPRGTTVPPRHAYLGCTEQQDGADTRSVAGLSPRPTGLNRPAPKAIVYPVSGAGVKGPRNVCRVLATHALSLAFRAVLLWLPLVASYVLVLRVATAVADGTNSWSLAAQVVSVALVAMVLAATCVAALSILTLRVALYHRSSPDNGNPSGMLHMRVDSPRAWLHGLYGALDCVVGMYIGAFLRGSWMYNALLALHGVQYESIWDTVMTGSWPLDGPLMSIGRGVVLDGCVVTCHALEHGALVFKPTSIGCGAAVHPLSILLGGDNLGAGVTLAGRSAVFSGRGGGAGGEPIDGAPLWPPAVVLEAHDFPPHGVLAGVPACAGVL